jgi:hypothetical protein
MHANILPGHQRHIGDDSASIDVNGPKGNQSLCLPIRQSKVSGDTPLQCGLFSRETVPDSAFQQFGDWG